MSKVNSGSTNKGESNSVLESSNNMLPLGIQGDNPGTMKLDGTNYLEWSQTTRMYIGGRGKLRYINGHVVEPSNSDTQTYKKWEFKDLKVMY